MPGTDMTPRIDPVAYLSVDGKTIEAYGPGNWGPPDEVPLEIAAWFTVVVSQVIKVPAASSSSLPSYEIVSAIGASGTASFRGNTVWWVTATVLNPPKTFVTGSGATVAAWSTIAHDDGGSESYEWTLPVMVEPHSARPTG